MESVQQPKFETNSGTDWHRLPNYLGITGNRVKKLKVPPQGFEP
ncbi:hypothetical protein BN931_1425 [Bifidobacterium animalis subsp. lactis CECT 8145]|nr:hypothetical protein BN931_1425 [Bifidobacterium animalis subsp. lactis CECT 8145]